MDTTDYSVPVELPVGDHPRSVALDEAANRVYVTNQDVPGIVGKLGSMFGSMNINIAQFYLGRDKQGGDAIALLAIDGPVDPEFLEQMRALPMIHKAQPLEFTV